MKLSILLLLKSLVKPTLYLNLTSWKYSISTKIIIILLTVIWPSVLCPIVGKYALNPISCDSSFTFRCYKYLFPMFSCWPIFNFLQIFWFLLLVFGSPAKLHIRFEFWVSLCIEHGYLILQILQYAIFLISISVLYVVILRKIHYVYVIYQSYNHISFNFC